MKFTVIPTPEILKNDVECIRITEHTVKTPLALNVCLNGLPGIVFQHHNGQSPLENITTRVGSASNIPTLFVYGQMTEPGIMNYYPQSFTSTQIVLKPHALQTLLGLNASHLTNALVELREFSAGSLNMQLMDARSQPQRLNLLLNFLVSKLQQARHRDCLVEESLSLIHKNSASVTVKHLLDSLSISERQFEKRFIQSVGLAPYFYIRVKRFNEALRLIHSGRFSKLTDVAHALNFYDQSHFIRDFKAFSGITPKNMLQKADLQADQRVYAYTET
ncbi:MAG: AraC family transcriptional regulator [Chloroflexota bacterium]